MHNARAKNEIMKDFLQLTESRHSENLYQDGEASEKQIEYA